MPKKYDCKESHIKTLKVRWNWIIFKIFEKYHKMKWRCTGYKKSEGIWEYKKYKGTDINLKFSAECSVQDAGCLKIKNEAYRWKKQSQYLYYRKEGNRENIVVS